MSKRARKARRLAQRKKVQSRFKSRVAAGKSGLTGGKKGTGPAGKQGSTISIYRAAQRKQVTDAAAKRNATFQANKKLKAAGGTSAQVAKDNQMYGNTVPEGSFGISEAGKAQAEANRKAAQEAAKKEATRKSMFSSDRLFGNYNAQIGGKLATTFADTFAKPKFMYQGNMAGRLPGLSNYFTPDVGTGTPYMKGGKLRGIPFTGGDKTGSLTKFKVPDGAKLSRSPLGVRQFKLDPSQMKKVGMGVTDDVSKFAAKGLGKYGLRAIPFVGAVPSLIDAGVRLKDKDYTGAALSVGSAIPGKVGWASLAGLAAHDINKSMNIGTETKTATTDAGGLNISGSSATTEKNTEGFGNNTKTGRVLNDIGDAINTYKGIFNDASAIKNALTPKQQFATFREDAAEQAALNKANNFTPDSKDVRSDIKSLFGTGVNYKDVANTVSDARAVVEGGAKAFKNLSPSDQQNLVTSAGGIIDNSKVFESFGKKYTGAEDFKNQTQGLLTATNKTLQEASQDTKGRVDPINNLLANFNNIKGLDPASKYLKTLENPNFINQRQRIQAAYDPTSPKAEALSAEDRGIVGSAGNLLIGGKLSDVFKANNPTERGTTFTPTDSANLIANTMIAANTPGSLTQQRFSEIGALTGQGTKVTPRTLIRGVIPRLGRSSGGGGTSVGQVRSGGSLPSVAAAALQQQQQEPVEELLLPTNADLPNLQDIQQQAYNQQMSIYGAPNYMAQFRPIQNVRPLRRRQYFNRDYFTQFA